jgi:hypothetical protein
LPLLPALALSTALLTGCSGLLADFKMLESYAKSPNVSYDNADAWQCDVTKVPNTKGVVEDCAICVNVDTRVLTWEDNKLTKLKKLHRYLANLVPSMYPSTGSGSNASPRKALVLLAVFIALCAGYANLSFFVHHPADFRFFPPFQAGYNRNSNRHLGAEYMNIARALVGRRGFSDPFAAGTGPTAWMPPVYPVLLAALLWLLRAVHRVAAVIVLLQCMVLWLGAYVVTRICRVVPTSVPAWLPLVFYGTWLTAYFDWFFQMTHDTWIIMLFVELMALGLLRLLERALSTAEAVSWGVFGGLTALTSPIAAVAWGALCVWLLVRRVQPAGAMVVSLLIGAAVVNVWTVRNVAVFHRLVLVKSNLAYDFYEGNFGPHDGVYDADYFGGHPASTTRADPNAPYRVLGEMGFIDSYQEKIRAALIDRPAEIPARSFRRLLAATLIYRPYRPAREGAHPVFVSLIHPLPALGAVLLLSLRRRGRPLLQNTILLAIAMYLTPYILIAFYPRYLLPLTPLLVLAWTWGADALWTTLRRRQRRLCLHRQWGARHYPRD